MAPPRSLPMTSSQRLALSLWVFGSMEMAGVQTTPMFVKKIGGDDSSGTDTKDSLRTRIDQYAKAQKNPEHVEDDSSLFGRVERYFPGSRRYLTSRMWPLLAGEEIGQEALADALQSCPGLRGCSAFATGESGLVSLADFDTIIRPVLDRNHTFWGLEALVLMEAWARASGDHDIGRKVAAYYRSVKADIALPPKTEHLRNDLAALCFSYMFETWPEADSLGKPDAEQPARKLFLGGRYLQWVTGVISVALSFMLAFSKTSSSSQFFFLVFAWIIVTLVTAFPQFGRASKHSKITTTSM